MLETLYNNVIRRGLITLDDCEFKIDGCTCYYVFVNVGHGIKVLVQLKYFYDKKFHNMTIYNSICRKNIGSFGRMIEIVKEKVNNSCVVGSSLKDKQEYSDDIGYCSLLSIKLDKCWLCFEDVLNKEHLKCGHLIHTKCAEQVFRMTGHFKCGICRENYGTEMYFERIVESKENISYEYEEDEEYGEDDENEDYGEDEEYGEDEDYEEDDEQGGETTEYDDETEEEGELQNLEDLDLENFGNFGDYNNGSDI